MFKYRTLRDQLIEEQNKNLVLNNLLLQMQANVDYIAMMQDIDIDLEEEGNEDVKQISESEEVL